MPTMMPRMTRFPTICPSPDRRLIDEHPEPASLSRKRSPLGLGLRLNSQVFQSPSGRGSPEGGGHRGPTRGCPCPGSATWRPARCRAGVVGNHRQDRAEDRPRHNLLDRNGNRRDSGLGGGCSGVLGHGSLLNQVCEPYARGAKRLRFHKEIPLPLHWVCASRGRSSRIETAKSWPRGYIYTRSTG